MSWMSSPHVTSGSACLLGRRYINTISTTQTPITSTIGLFIHRCIPKSLIYKKKPRNIVRYWCPVRSITLNLESCIVPSADNLCHPSSGCLAASRWQVHLIL
ncbi:hypothetical protein BDQ94DRAFT_5208 [Aspergillus welwitschiae]|uniref:Uncharacterized protein n=1 Tax=Aspergillus welwitschiae TaxID=1341132 RepID=A0A3F3QJT7_9EURO|nr:hypothetical protein BDQ94DRAFT_5208 [Aspergillus welwitschiae]RDH39395.1 hypothetical protein BDQ94DRAFT_5208 [Aspergillus welwitschiae]